MDSLTRNLASQSQWGRENNFLTRGKKDSVQVMSKFVPGGKFPNSRLAFVTTLFILLEGEHRILSLINIGTVRT
jgi:hypothetical protein